MKIIKKVLSILVLLVLIYLFVAHPNKPVGGNPGPYKEGDTVFAMSVYIYKFFNALRPGDVVIIQTRNSDDIAQIVGIPEELAKPNTYYLSKEKLEGVIPANFYIVSFNNSETLWAVPESQIIRVVWGSI